MHTRSAMEPAPRHGTRRPASIVPQVADSVRSQKITSSLLQRVAAGAAVLRAEEVVGLQRTLGNAAVAAALGSTLQRQRAVPELDDDDDAPAALGPEEGPEVEVVVGLDVDGDVDEDAAGEGGRAAAPAQLVAAGQPPQRAAEPRAANVAALPDALKRGAEALSGIALDDVRVHYASSAPARVGALAHAQGTDIHLGPGQERHLPHETWHVVQQKQGRVQPTLQVAGTAVNDDPALEAEADTMGARAASGGVAAQPAAAGPSGAAAPAQRVVQRVNARVNMKGGRVVRATLSGRAPAGNLRGHRGDHTTPYVTFLHMAENCALGNTLPEAMQAVEAAVDQVQSLPGYVGATGAYRNNLDKFAVGLKARARRPKPSAAQLQAALAELVGLRNAVPLSAFKNRKSTGGHNEAGTAGGLLYAEKQVLNGAWTDKGDFPGNPARNVWDTFDFGAPPKNSSAGDWVQLLKQHMLSMLASYPRVFSIFAANDVKDELPAFLKKRKFKQPMITAILANL